MTKNPTMTLFSQSKRRAGKDRFREGRRKRLKMAILVQLIFLSMIQNFNEDVKAQIGLAERAFTVSRKKFTVSRKIVHR